MTIQTLKNLDVNGKIVLVRVDFNAPVQNGQITDSTRLEAHLPTIEWLIDNKARIILMSHLGRPEGQKSEAFSLKPVAVKLSSLLGRKVTLTPDCVGDKTGEMVKALGDGDVLLLENLRFYREEEDNNEKFAKKLASFADIYVNDAFATAHRSHASTVGVPEFAGETAMGFLMEKEIHALEKLLQNPTSPFVSIIGGAKVSSKIDVLRNLLPKSDMMMIGGAMANTFLASMGKNMGNSLYESDYLQAASRILSDSAAMGCRLLLPVDLVIANELSENADAQVVGVDAVPKGALALDIGPKTVELWTQMIGKAGTILWNGPMGAAETPPFQKGSVGIAEAVAKSNAYSVAGGGDTIAALNQSDVAGELSFISTGGGALIEALEGRTLPGIAALES